MESGPYINLITMKKNKKKKKKMTKPRSKRSRRTSPWNSRKALFPSYQNSAPPCRKKTQGCCSGFASSSGGGDEVSCDSSSRVTVESSGRKRKSTEECAPPASSSRINTRSYRKWSKGDNGVEVSESSCVEETDSRAASCTKVNDAVSVSSPVESCLSLQTVEGVHDNRAPEEKELSEISKNDAVASIYDDSVTVAEADLACREHFSYDDVVSDYSSSHETAAFSELFPECSSELDFSEYTPSIFLDSASQFSEKSFGDSAPSPTHSVLQEFRQQFLRSSAPPDTRRSSVVEAECLGHATQFVRFEGEEDEESYRKLRERERRQVFMHDYVELYRSTTEHAELILEQRCLMVHWIVEQSTRKELQYETMFLGVNLLDQFLGKGFFESERNLQIVGIACLMLATRIEENQPYNSVRQKNFRVGCNVYNRCEVVAMEWLVQEVLNFQCFLPTVYNFLWFYLKAAKADAEVEKRAKYLAVLALSNHEQLEHWPSTVAAGVVILAVLESDLVESYKQVIEVHVRTKEDYLHKCIKSLERLLQYVN